MKLLRLVIIFIIEIALALLIILLRGVSFTMMNLSDHFFVVGVIIGLPSIVAITQAFRLFYGFRYAARIFITPNYRKIYPSFCVFKNQLYHLFIFCQYLRGKTSEFSRFRRLR